MKSKELGLAWAMLKRHFLSVVMDYGPEANRRHATEGPYLRKVVDQMGSIEHAMDLLKRKDVKSSRVCELLGVSRGDLYYGRKHGKLPVAQMSNGPESWYNLYDVAVYALGKFDDEEMFEIIGKLLEEL